MKKIIMPLLAALFILSSTAVFADDDQGTSDQKAPPAPDTAAPSMPKFPPLPDTSLTHQKALKYNGRAILPPMMSPRTVVATSDGGVVIVEGNKMMKFDKDLQETQVVDISDTHKQ